MLLVSLKETTRRTIAVAFSVGICKQGSGVSELWGGLCAFTRFGQYLDSYPIDTPLAHFEDRDPQAVAPNQ